MPIPKAQEKCTVEEYMTWNDGQRWELIDGMIYDMTPAPNIKHQTILLNLTRILDNYLQGKSCSLFFAPTDVVLSEYDVVQPDLLVVCDRAKITEKNIQGAPDLIIEVLSPSTAKKDHWEKKNLYERSGVKEYLLVDPEGQFVERFRWGADGLFGRSEIFGARETLPLHTLDGLSIPLWEIFGVDPPETRQT